MGMAAGCECERGVAPGAGWARILPALVERAFQGLGRQADRGPGRDTAARPTARPPAALQGLPHAAGSRSRPPGHQAPRRSAAARRCIRRNIRTELVGTTAPGGAPEQRQPGRAWHPPPTTLVFAALRGSRAIRFTWGGSSAGRASRSQCEGREFDPPPLHQFDRLVLGQEILENRSSY